MARHGARGRALLLAAGLALATGLVACSGTADDGAPAGATETAAPPAASTEPPAAAPSPALAAPAAGPETAHPPTTPPDPPLPELPAEPDDPGPLMAPLPNGEPVPPGTGAPEPPTAPGDPAVPDPANPPVDPTAPVAETRILRYDTFDPSGSVAEPGHYTFLADPHDPSSVVTTYEGLRDGTAIALLIHTHDVHGISQAVLYDAVAPGDLFEWRQAGDCWVRYQVTEVKPDPTGTVPQKLLGVEWMTYAFTGCSGTIATTTAATLDWADLPDLGGTSLTTPIRHGSTQLVPQDWTGALEDPEPYHEVPVPNFLQADADDSDDHHGSTDYETTGDLTEARTYPYWRTPTLPEGWMLSGAHTHGDCVTYGYCAIFKNADGRIAFEISGGYAVNRGFPVVASWSPNGNDLIVREARVIAGRPAIVRYSPPGPTYNYADLVVHVYDPAAQAAYRLKAHAGSLPGSEIDTLIAIAASLFENPPRLRYDTYAHSGSVAEPGHYAFLADPEDPASVIMTYEELRDGTATALRIHTHDAHGIPQTALYAAVEPGDLFEWRQAADCFVRYQVTEVQSDPTGTVPQKLLTVAWMTYAFAGCSGAIATATAATLDWADLPDLGGTSLTTPVRHGPFQIVPEGWTGTTEEPEVHAPPAYNRDNPRYTTTLATARQLPYWRDPALPTGWTFFDANVDPEETVYGYMAAYLTPRGGLGLLIEGQHATGRGWPEQAAWRPNGNDLGVAETRVIAGRPARVAYSPSGPSHIFLFPVAVWVYDPATESEYTLYGYTKSLRGAYVDAVIAIARSLFEPPNPP